MKKGRFIVIEGTDGAGKGTQLGLLTERLKREKICFEICDFPQYEKPSAFFVEKYLHGEYGKSEEVGPYRASLFFGLDRYDKSHEIKKWLSEGKVVISNRYTTSNMGHQAGKIKNVKERENFLNWLNDTEYKILGNPKPDRVIFLNVKPEIGQKLVESKGTRAYLKGKKKDILEEDLKHLKNAYKAYNYVAKKFSWTTIDCAPKGTLLSREDIHELIWKKLNLK